MNYTIGEFSRISNISIYTLRYYEKENLVKPHRLDNRRRYYTDDDIRWIQFIKRLKDTGMPIKEIKRYAKLREEGNSTIEERMNMLIEHKKNLEDNIKTLNDHLLNLNNKIDYYKTEFDREVI